MTINTHLGLVLCALGLLAIFGSFLTGSVTTRTVAAGIGVGLLIGGYCVVLFSAWDDEDPPT